MEKFSEHHELPWMEYGFGIASNKQSCLIIISPTVYAPQDRKFIVEACNNYYRLKEQNEKLLSALESAKTYVDNAYECAFPDSIENQYVRDKVNEAIKSC